MTLWVDIHAVQTLPINNLNRDDSGSFKSLVYGGTERARVSSQAWKRVIREKFNENSDEDRLSYRTKNVVLPVYEEIIKRAPEIDPKEAVELASKVISSTGIKFEKGKKETNDDELDFKLAESLVFMSASQVRALAKIACDYRAEEDPKEKKAIIKLSKEAFKQGRSLDLSLFGRMVASSPDLAVDAACQVAHAMGVHPVSREVDYFTATDDLASEENSGAAMIGMSDFNSSSLYRYATINVDLLHKNLGSIEATAEGVAAFIEAFLTTVPSGKINTFGHNCSPEAVIVSVRSKRPVNLSQAFECPSQSEGISSQVKTAVEDMVEQYVEEKKAYGDDVVGEFVLRVGKNTEALDAIGQRMPLKNICEQVKALIMESQGGERDD